MGVCSTKNAPSSPDKQNSLLSVKNASSCESVGDSISPDLAHVMSSIDNQGRLRDSYSVDSARLGVGTFSTVSRGQHRSSKHEYAIKTISKAKVKNFERIRQEISVMRMLDHGNIIKLRETFEDKRTIRLVMELCTGGELSDRLIEVGKFTEAQAAGLMQQIFQAVSYMHQQQVCHRDLKPDNILFASRLPIEQSTLKVIDLGSACAFQKGQHMHTKAGSSYYVAPQVLLGKYDHSSDLWSCGVIMHILLCGYPPFTGETEEDVLIKVKKGALTFVAKDWHRVSEDAQALVSMLIRKSPQERYTAEQALDDGWTRDRAPKADQQSLDNVTQLRRFQSGRKLRKASTQIIAERVTEGQIRALDEIFQAFDRSGSGRLGARQLRKGLKRAGLEELPGELEETIEELCADAKDDGTVDYKKFVADTLAKKQVMQETACWNAFSDNDRDGDGLISHEDFQAVLRNSTLQEAFGSFAIEDALQKASAVNDRSSVDFDDLVGLMSACSSEGRQML